MTNEFPSVNGLTWQEWRTTTFPMESTDNQANRLSKDPLPQGETPGTLSTLIDAEHPFFVDRHTMCAPHLPVGSPERAELFRELRKTFCEDWKAAEESVQREREAKFGDLYFVSAGDAVKIGRTTNFTTRLRFIQAHNHEETKCLLLLKGQGWRENEFHRRFRVHRLRGEWFERCAEIEAEIERLRP